MPTALPPGDNSFIYQGFNDRVGWMHTTSGIDAVDEYVETVVKRNGKFVYKHGSEFRPVVEKQIVVPYKSGQGTAEKKFTAYYTAHGPVIREEDGKWVSIHLMVEPIKALTESYTRTKAKNYKAYRQTMELKANSSNNTIYADAEGTIAYFHGNYLPRRDTSFDWTKPVDGSIPATDWKGLHAVDDLPNLLNPASGWLYNSNNSPWSAAGPSSRRKGDFPAYVEMGTENPRGLHALRVLSNKKDFTLDSLIAAAYDSYLPWFERALPSLIKAWDGAAPFDPLKARLSDQIRLLRGWDYRWSVDSTATTLAIYWGEELRRARVPIEEFVPQGMPAQLLAALDAATGRPGG